MIKYITFETMIYLKNVNLAISSAYCKEPIVKAKSSWGNMTLHQASVYIKFNFASLQINYMNIFSSCTHSCQIISLNVQFEKDSIFQLLIIDKSLHLGVLWRLTWWLCWYLCGYYGSQHLWKILLQLFQVSILLVNWI